MMQITVRTRDNREIKITLSELAEPAPGNSGVQAIYDQSYVVLEVDDRVVATLYPRNECLDDYKDGQLGFEVWEFDIETGEQSCAKVQDEVYSV